MTPEDVRKIIDLKNPKIPKRLFKYRSINKFSTANLLDKTLWCDHSSTFNDPYDSALQVTVANPGPMEDLLDKAKAELPQDQFQRLLELITHQNSQLSEEVSRDLTNKLRDVYRICSLSERIDSMLMWSHYSSDHKAFAMEYDFRRFGTPEILQNSLWPVIYDDYMIDVGHILSGSLSKSNTSNNNLFGIAAVIQKAMDWKYEQEWRLVLIGTPSQNVSAPLKAVYLGARISEHDKQALIAAANFVGVPAYQMKLAERSFAMTYDLIDT